MIQKGFLVFLFTFVAKQSYIIEPQLEVFTEEQCLWLIFPGYNLVRGSVITIINKKVIFHVPPSVELSI